MTLKRAKCLAEDPFDARIVYFGGTKLTSGQYQMVAYRSSNFGATWPDEMLIGNPWPSSRTTCYEIVPAHSDPSIITAVGVENDQVAVYRSIDSGLTWDDITGDLTTMHSSNDYVRSFWVAPDDPDLLVAGTTNGVFASADGGASWSATSVAALTYKIVHHTVTDTLFAGTYGRGVFKSEDRGATWVAINEGLDVLLIYDLDIDAKQGLLYAGTYGGSVCLYDLEPSPLWAGVDQFPEGTGGTVKFVLDAGAAHADRGFLLTGSLSGTDPGTLLPGGLATIPLNRDWFTDYILDRLNTKPFTNFWGTLDTQGRATAELIAPPIPGWSGRVVYFAFCTASPYDYASNPVEVFVTD